MVITLTLDMGGCSGFDDRKIDVEEVFAKYLFNIHQILIVI